MDEEQTLDLIEPIMDRFDKSIYFHRGDYTQVGYLKRLLDEAKVHDILLDRERQSLLKAYKGRPLPFLIQLFETLVFTRLKQDAEQTILLNENKMEEYWYNKNRKASEVETDIDKVLLNAPTRTNRRGIKGDKPEIPRKHAKSAGKIRGSKQKVGRRAGHAGTVPKGR